jgi:dolichyl-phosphate-mannose-protein mannosyltransferase
VLLLLSAIVLLRASTLVIPIFNSDEAYIAMQAQVLGDGGQLYRDIADRKPPLVQYIYAVTFMLCGSDDLIAVHVVAILWMFATALVLRWDATRRFGEHAGWWAAALFVVSSTCYLPAETQAANFEIFMLLPACLGMALAHRRTLPTACGAGLAIGLATLCKQTAGVTLIAAALSIWGGTRRGPGLLALLATFSSVLLGAAAALGPRELYFWTVGGNASYLSADGVLAYTLVRFFLVTLSFLAANAVLTWLTFRTFRTRGRDTRDLWGWLILSAIGVAAGLRFFGHYYLQLLPPACLLASVAAANLGERARRRVIVALGICAIIFGLLAFFSRRIHGMPDYLPLARYVQDHTRPTDRIAIWGHFPEVYWASDRRPAMRFVHTGFLTGASSGRPAGNYTERWTTPGAWDLLFEDFAVHPPQLLIDTSPAGLRDYQHYPIARYPRLLAFVSKGYRQIAIVDGMIVYERLPGQATSPRDLN